jgi:hypothetical protein
LSQPHAVYDLRIGNVVAGRGLASATQTGFRYLVTGGGEAIAAAEVQANAAGTATLLANINYGPYVEATSQALTQVAALPSVAAASYEVRLLRSAPIYLIYPVAPAPPGLQAGQPYAEADFISAILPLAQKRAAKSDPATVP